MQDLWPWLAVAGAGALHGMNPASGWVFAAALACHDKRRAIPALIPIAIGHMASLGLVAAAVVYGLPMNRVVLAIAIGLLLVLGGIHCIGRKTLPMMAAPASQAGLALWSLVVSTAHGTGLMLVPAFVPLCMTGSPAGQITASGSLLLASAAAGVHMAAMLITTGVLAIQGRKGVHAAATLWRKYRHKHRHYWPAP